MRTLWRAALVGAAGALIAAVIAVPAMSDDAQRPGRYPGLPYIPCGTDIKGEGSSDSNLTCEFLGPDATNDYAWLNFPQVGLAGSVKAKQWSRVPISMMATAIEIISEPRPEENVQNEYWYKVQAFFVSPDGSEGNYGDSALMPVRTVAFGSIPAEVTLQVSQRRDSAGLPRALVFRPHDIIRRPSNDDNTTVHTVFAATLSEKVDVKVRSLVVDGVPVDLEGACGTGPDSQLTVSSKELTVVTPPDWDTSQGLTKLEGTIDPTEYQFGLFGGTLDGSIDIAAFDGCRTTTGDDLAPLLTAAVSAEDNPLAVRIGAAGGCTYYDDLGRSQPVPPGVTDPSEACPLTDLGYPNKKVVVIPKVFDIPDHAPGQPPR